MSSKTPTLGVNNILSFNGHGGKISGKSFTLDPNSNVYILVPFGLDVELPPGQTKKKTDTTFKGLDVCYTSFSPGAGSFEEIIYGNDGKLKLTFNDKKTPSSQNVDAKWHLYKPGDVVPNVNYFAWKKGDSAANAKTCDEVSNEYDPFISTIMTECLNSDDGNLNKKVCAYFVSDSKKTNPGGSGKTTSAVFTDSNNKYHLKLKICGSGDDTTPTTTLKELAKNCRELVEFSKGVVKKSKTSSDSAVSSVYASGYEDANILPKSEPTDPIILMPFTCNSCNTGTDIVLANDTSDLKKVATLSEIIASLAPITLDEQKTIFKYDKSDVLNISDYISVINTIYESTKTKPIKTGLDGSIISDYHDVLPSGSASIIKLDEFSSTKNNDSYSINRDENIKFILQAAPGSSGQKDLPSYGADGLTNSVYNCLYLANENGVTGIAFPIIGGQIFFDELKITKNKLYELLLQGVANYFNDFSDSKIEIVLFAQPNIEDNSGSDNFEEVFNTFLTKYTHINKILKKQKNTNKKKDPTDKIDDHDASVFAVSKIYNDIESNSVKITALVNAANTELSFGDGLSKAFKAQIDAVYINGDGSVSDRINKNSNVLIKKFHKAYDEYVKSLTGSSSPPPKTSTKTKQDVVKVIEGLVNSIKETEDDEAKIATLGIKEPTNGLFYEYPPSDASSPPSPPLPKKNLNSADPAIDVMIKAFETADGGETNFYLGACRSIQAAYDLEMSGIVDSDASAKQAKMRAKLLLNLRKNSLLLKVPKGWDYATMQPGVEPEPVSTPDEDKNKYEELQKECEALKQLKGNGYDTSEEAYKLAEKLIPLDEKMEIDKLEKKNKVVLENYPDDKITYLPIKDVISGYNLVLKQDDMNCGRAALANFFGTEDFLIKGDPTKTEELFNLKIQRPDKIDMSSICHLNKKYSDIFVDVPNNTKDKEDYKYVTNCPGSENYSINVLSIVLQVLGYKDLTGITFDKKNMTQYEDNKVKLNESYNNKDVLGYLVNINKGHWVCYKRENIGSTNNSFYRIDSMTSNNFSDARTLQNLVEYDSTTLNKDFIQLHPITKNDDSNNQKIFSELTNIDEGKRNYYTDLIKKNEINEKWKLFYKEITSVLVKESEYASSIDNQVRIMNYLSNLPSNKSAKNKNITIGINDDGQPYDSIKSKILSLTPEKKQKVINLFIENIKKNLKNLDFIKATCNLRNIAYDKENNLYEPDFDAKNRYYYSLTQTCNYKTDANFSTDLTSGDYYKSANELLVSIDTLFKTSEFTGSSPGGGGFKPRHNPITNHTASKSRHNSSFKVSSSSKSKGKSHNRSHTQRVK